MVESNELRLFFATMLFDIIGALTSLFSTYFFIRMSNKAWPIGMLATAVNGWLYWDKGIYADMLLEVFYFLSMCYGWYLWRKPQTSAHKAPSSALNRLSSGQGFIMPVLLLMGFALIYYLLRYYTNSNVAFMDAATTSLSLTAQWLMCHKMIMTWVLWFVTDAIYALMYFGKELPFHAILMLVYTALAVSGYWVWMKRNTNTEAIALSI